MKYILIVTFLALQILGIHAQEQYRVVSRTQLNVRSGPGTDYSVIGSLAPRSIVSVTATRGNWSAIAYQGRTGYVASRYISPLPIPRAARSHTFFSEYSLFWPLLLLVLTLLPVFIREAGISSCTTIWIVRLSLIGTAIVELIYFIGMNCELWWCQPSQVGWGWAIAGVFISFIIFFLQYQYLKGFSDPEPENPKTSGIHTLNIVSLVACIILISYKHTWVIFLYPAVLFCALYLRCRSWSTALLYTFLISLYSIALLGTLFKLMYFIIIVLTIGLASQMLGTTYVDRYGNVCKQC